MTDPAHPYDQQPGEPMLWFARFEAFRRLGPGRSILAVYNAEPGKARKGPADSAPGAWKQAAAEWRWSERAEAWDQAQLRTARGEESEALAEMRRRHMAQGQGLQKGGAVALTTLLADKERLAALPVRDLIALIQAGTALERQARGEPDQVLKHQHADAEGGKLAAPPPGPEVIADAVRLLLDAGFDPRAAPGAGGGPAPALKLTPGVEDAA
jgi:hypothetical protein